MNNEILRSIIINYRNEHPADPWIEKCRTADSLTTVITIALRDKDENGRKYPHRYCIKKEVLDSQCLKLLPIIQDFENLITSIDKQSSVHFDIILQFLVENKASGFGELCIYDAALMMANYFNAKYNLAVLPEEVYLHRGTREGVENLFKKKIKKKSFKMAELPAIFAEMGVTAEEAENIFCIYKDKFGNNQELYIPEKDKIKKRIGIC